MASDSYDYYTINKSELSKAIRDACVETVSDDDLVTSVEATPKVILKTLAGAKPPAMSAFTPLTKGDAPVEFAKPKWNPGEE